MYVCSTAIGEKKWRKLKSCFLVFGLVLFLKNKLKCIDITVMCKTHCAARIVLEISHHFCVSLPLSKACPEEY